MKQIIHVYKPIGMTPLELIKNIKIKYPEYQNEKLGYAGRLDPMAEGLVVILVGEENKKRKFYEDLPKTYKCKIIFGIETDTYDQLGIVTNTSTIHTFDSIKLKTKIKNLLGKHIQPYPPYSSQPVNGKPLFYWARQKKLTGLKIPTKKIEIYSIDLINFEQKSVDILVEQIQKNITKVQGDFRQEEILETWTNIKNIYTGKFFLIVELKITCSSGTYIRSLAHKLGQEMSVGAFAFSINRTEVGKYNIVDSIKI